MMFVGTHKNKKKKKKVEEIIGNKRSRVGTNRRWLKMTQTDKEKLRMAKNLVKANNKKIKKALKKIDEFENSGTYVSYAKPRIWIKEILEKWLQKIIKIIKESKSTAL